MTIRSLAPPPRTLPPGGRMGAVEHWPAWPSTAKGFAAQRRERERHGDALSE